MQTTVIYSDGDNIRVSPPVRKWMGNQKEFLAIIAGDSLIVKKAYSLLDFAIEPDEDFMPIEKISGEVHMARENN
ncbi:hypothetical protein PITCH_A1260051 [uncultured Desulfobacterium sp.]|uniref:Uncharacterized protein n=1 Tax=uncultured Desulfobacterium sp. TaxID=201089 RepID=A0A445MRZ9_9BACT|nr:hypothetical protein PITCH_A1260051 [uncultured Desulfobacterium sp.]